jgi:DinB family protein
MAGIAESMAGAFDYAWKRFRGRLAGLEDAEYFWEPVPDCWSVRQAGDGRWVIDAAGGDVSAGPPPDPAPMTTIAWRIGHIGLTFIGFGDRLFGAGAIGVDDVPMPGSAAAALGFLDRSYHRYWRDKFAEITADRWWREIGPAFGPYASNSTADLALHVLDEFIHHAAEVSLLRDLYRHRESLGRG